MAIALTMFERDLPVARDRALRSHWASDAERRAALEVEAWRELGLDPTESGSWFQVEALVEVRLKREKWGAGVMPDSYLFRLPFIHAKTFLFALDRIDKILRELAKEEKVPSAVGEVHARFLAAFPDLRGVRNSTAHVEDRARGLDKHGRPLELKAVDNEMVKAHGGVLIIESLAENRITATMDDGTCGEVEVSTESLDIAQQVIQDAINVFQWTGPASHLPL